MQFQLLQINPNKTLQLQQTLRGVLWYKLRLRLRLQTRPLLWDLRQWMWLLLATPMPNLMLDKGMPQGDTPNQTPLIKPPHFFQLATLPL